MAEHNFIVETLKTRLDKYLAQQLPGISRSQIQRDIEGGLAEVNGRPVTSSKFVVRLNDKIVYHPSDKKTNEEVKPANIPLQVLYDNHGLLIIDKPAGLTVHPGAGFKGETLASALLYHFSAKGGSAFGGKDIRFVGEEHRPGIVHRLDKDTSGVMLVARTPEMYRYLKDAFAERKIKKEYIALVKGKVEKPHGFIDTPIGKSKADFRKQTVKDPVEAKPAITEYQILEYLKGEEGENGEKGERVDCYTLLMVKLHTGRTHQIRVHMASIGHPLMGDTLYGGKETVFAGLQRQFLHAKKIEVRLPDGMWIEAESELSDDLKSILVSLKSKIVSSL